MLDAREFKILYIYIYIYDVCQVVPNVCCRCMATTCHGTASRIDGQPLRLSLTCCRIAHNTTKKDGSTLRCHLLDTSPHCYCSANRTAHPSASPRSGSSSIVQ
ncbi:unnamed protein product [Sphacelaria rigidula]